MISELVSELILELIGDPDGCPLTNFKDVAAAFGLDQKGTIADLIGCYHQHMETHSELATDPRFAKLFSV